jgi:hypothetical protein
LILRGGTEMKRLTHSPEARQRIAVATRAAMAAPAVRQKISVATKRGMAARAADEFPELSGLRAAWCGARSSVRRAFIAEILAPVFSGPEGA